MFKGVLKSQFDPSCSHFSPVQVEHGFKKDIDEDGREIITFPVVDNRKITESLGTVDDWSLRSLAAAGIDPNFKISTSSNVRLDAQNGVNEFINEIDKIESEKSEN